MVLSCASALILWAGRLAPPQRQPAVTPDVIAVYEKYLEKICNGR